MNKPAPAFALLLRLIRPYRWRVAAATAAMLLGAGMVLLMGRGLEPLVDDALASSDPAALSGVIGALFGVALLMAAFSFFRINFVNWLGERAVADLRGLAFRRAVALGPAYYESAKTADIQSRLTADTAVIQTVIGSSVSWGARNAVMMIGGLSMMAATSAKMTLLVGVLTPAVLIPIIWLGRRVRRLSRDAQDRIGDLGAAGSEALEAIREVHAYGQQDRLHARVVGRAEEAFQVAARRTRMRATLAAVASLLALAAIGLLLYVGGRDLQEGRLSPGELSSFVFFAVLTAVSAAAASETYSEIQRAIGAAERLADLLATPPDITPPPEPVIPPPSAPKGAALSFEGVGFHYPARPDAPALSDVSFRVSPGETVALVGPSGAGKSTIFNLILRFYDPDSGVVRLDGVDARAADLDSLRGRIAMVSQDPAILSADATENIRFGRPDADDVAVRAAAEAAAAHAFIAELPEGYETFLGERGVRLSGGQKQRIAIARAILRDPALLLLDEATSALDAESERQVQAALDTLRRGRTTLVIAHRLATVRAADRILVFDRGRIVEEGRHEQLAAKGGLYARLAALQFADGLAA